MTIRDNDNDRYTVAAISVFAMCLVTFDHEALGHGGVCLASGGHIRLLTSSLFQCDLRSIWIDPAGPIFNLLGGLVALLLVRVTPHRWVGRRLFLILVTCFSFYWESGYVIKAMVDRHGDLYFAGENFLGEPSRWWRVAAAAAGLGLYVFTTRWAVRSLSALWPDSAMARRAARLAWVSATLGAALAAMTYSGEGFADLRDAVLEIGGASFPLLFIPRNNRVLDTRPGPGVLRHDRITIALSLVVYAVFVATLGRGMHFPKGVATSNAMQQAPSQETGHSQRDGPLPRLVLDGPHPAFLVQGDDELGALAEIHMRLSDGRVNVYASTGVADGRGSFGYIIYVRQKSTTGLSCLWVCSRRY